MTNQILDSIKNYISTILLNKKANLSVEITEGSDLRSIGLDSLDLAELTVRIENEYGVEAFSINSAREWGERGIRSNCLVAGFMETDMSAGLTTDQKNRIFKRTALKLPTSIESVARMIEFLISNDSQSITGQNIFVDSGTI
jgi:acyl carrier protein